jgi:apolipoprotein N-acyltransferase
MASKPEVSSPSPALKPEITLQYRAFAVLALAASAICFFFGTGLHPVWWLTWLAPLPILLAVPRLSRGIAFALAFSAYTLGALNMWSYLRVVTPIGLTLVILCVPSLVFALIVLAHRRFILRGQTLRAVFALPVLWTAVEYLVEFRSPHSTFGNLAYTQMD